MGMGFQRVEIPVPAPKTRAKPTGLPLPVHITSKLMLAAVFSLLTRMVTLLSDTPHLAMLNIQMCLSMFVLLDHLTICLGPSLHLHNRELVLPFSVASAQADVFATKLSKIGKILRIFDNLDKIKSRWVLCQN
jgi:hypothetical protein